MIAAVELAVTPAQLPAMRELYGETLGLPLLVPGRDAALGVDVGDGPLSFTPCAEGEAPFYHFALLVPGNRFAAAREWAAERVALLARSGESETTFDFAFWDAEACYFRDPAGNIVELIAHHGLTESPNEGPFGPGEIVGISELGCVAREPARAAADLAAAGLHVWSGTVEGEAPFAFVGRKARTLILCPPGHAWLPTGRPAEPHPLRASLRTENGSLVGVRIEGGRLRVTPADHP